MKIFRNFATVALGTACMGLASAQVSEVECFGRIEVLVKQREANADDVALVNGKLALAQAEIRRLEAELARLKPAAPPAAP
jgi:uncharacterized small protein (DUF1192 family)